MSEAALSVSGLSAGYGRRLVLDGVSLEVPPGEIFGLAGLNGAGKTTLMKSLLSLMRPRAGTALIFGRDSLVPESRKSLSYLPESFRPSGLLTGRQFLRNTLSAHGAKLEDGSCRETLTGLDFNPADLDRPIRGLSKGMGQKLGLAACLLAGTRLLVLDEPMTALDPKARILVKRRLLAHRSAGGTVFLSSHILSDLDEICGRIGILSGGVLRFVGPPADLRARHPGLGLEEAFLAELGEAELSGETAMMGAD
jgi:ABC-2 type transport system ATP-binding protein